MAAPKVVSMIEIPGDPEELRIRTGALEEVAARKAKEFGGISSTVIRTDDGITIINFWDSEDGRHKMGDDPEVRQAVADAGLPAPSARGYEVLAHRTTS